MRYTSSPAPQRNRAHFADLLAGENLTLADDLLVPFAHWVTPVIYPKRYDTHFFLARAPEDHTAEHDDHESVDSLWISLMRALADADQGRGKLEFATRRNLEKLARHDATEAALAATLDAKIVTVLRTVSGPESAHTVTVPAEADYGGSVFLMTN